MGLDCVAEGVLAIDLKFILKKCQYKVESVCSCFSVSRHYDKKAAEGAQYLRELEKGKYEKEGDVYVEHEAVVNKQDATQRAKEVFLVSSKRVVYITYHQVLGNWAVEWEFLYK